MAEPAQQVVHDSPVNNIDDTGLEVVSMAEAVVVGLRLLSIMERSCSGLSCHWTHMFQS